MRKTTRVEDKREKYGIEKIRVAKLCTTNIPSELKEIEILKIDELFTYYQKKPKRPMSGLLWTENGIKLLISR